MEPGHLGRSGAGRMADPTGHELAVELEEPVLVGGVIRPVDPTEHELEAEVSEPVEVGLVEGLGLATSSWQPPPALGFQPS